MTNQPSTENVERARQAITHGYIRDDVDRLVDDIAQTLQAVEDAAERRGAVRGLRELACDEDWIYPDVIKCILNRANELEQQLPQREGE